MVDSHENMDEHSFTSHGVPVITGDASGGHGAAHHAGEMLIWEYPPEESAPVQSSNYSRAGHGGEATGAVAGGTGLQGGGV